MRIKMKENIEFQEIGKKLPYQVPVGFFEQVSESTLRKARQREQVSRKSLMPWRSIAVAASLSALALLGYFMFEPGKSDKNLIVQEKQSESIQWNEKEKGISEQNAGVEIMKEIPQNTIEIENETEGVSDVLADLTDEELLQIAAMIKTDPFMAESPQ